MSTGGEPITPAAHRAATREAYDRLARVWSETTDQGPWNGLLERPALQSLVPRPLRSAAVLDAGCGSGTICQWLAAEGAHVTGIDLSSKMIEQARERCDDDVELRIADLGEPLDVEPGSFDGVICSLTLHYLEDWSVPLTSFATALRSGGWAVVSTGHPFAPPLPAQRGGYFDRELVSETWTKADVTVTQQFWRRPLGEAMQAFAEAGFLVEQIIEPRPTKDAVARFPELQTRVETPSFIAYQLRQRMRTRCDGRHAPVVR